METIVFNPGGADTHPSTGTAYTSVIVFFPSSISFHFADSQFVLFRVDMQQILPLERLLGSFSRHLINLCPE
jgi:hypothetical protein